MIEGSGVNSTEIMVVSVNGRNEVGSVEVVMLDLCWYWFVSVRVSEVFIQTGSRKVIYSDSEC